MSSFEMGMLVAFAGYVSFMLFYILRTLNNINRNLHIGINWFAEQKLKDKRDG